MSNWKAPILRVGDPVKFHADPHNDNAKPYVGWCLSEATHNDATTLLVFTPEVGFIEKVAIRHRENPVLRDKPSLAAMGGWSEADITLDMKKIKQAKFAAMTTHEKASKETKTSHKGK
jgi:hypothetical protein